MKIYACQNQLYILFKYGCAVISGQPHLVVLGKLAVGFYYNIFRKVIARKVGIAPAVVIGSKVACAIAAQNIVNIYADVLQFVSVETVIAWYSSCTFKGWRFDVSVVAVVMPARHLLCYTSICAQRKKDKNKIKN
jgi:hypothetical protein